MHDQNSVTNRAICDEQADKRAQRDILALVLTEHPMHLTRSQLCHELDSRGSTLSRGDVIYAIERLITNALLQCNGALIVPTRAALHFNGLNPLAASARGTSADR